MQRARLGVIIGRFQVDNITGGHESLIEEVRRMHSKVLILIGTSPVPFTKHNPLDFSSRAIMIQEKFPGITCLPIMDHPSDEVWSQNVDSLVRSVFPIGSACIYGGRDSFLPYYTGNLDAVEFPAADYRPGEAIREEIGNMIPSTTNGRRGAIYATQNRYPTAFVCVDMIIWKRNGEDLSVILGSKVSDNGKLRFPGGFLDPGESLEEACKRETFEEVGVEVKNYKYLSSMNTNDWRYRSGEDKLTTCIFTGEYNYGAVQAGDDLVSAAWYNIFDLMSAGQVKSEKFASGHDKIMNLFIDLSAKELSGGFKRKD